MCYAMKFIMINNKGLSRNNQHLRGRNNLRWIRNASYVGARAVFCTELVRMIRDCVDSPAF